MTIQDFKTEWQSTFLELEVQLEEELPSLLDVLKLQSFQHKITHFGDGYHCSTISREGGILFYLFCRCPLAEVTVHVQIINTAYLLSCKLAILKMIVILVMLAELSALLSVYYINM